MDTPSVRPAAISNAPAETFLIQSNQAAMTQRYEQVRMEGIQNRRLIAGKIVELLPDGLVVGRCHTNLRRAPLNSSGFLPGTVPAAPPATRVEANPRDPICVGLVFVADLPKS